MSKGRSNPRQTIKIELVMPGQGVSRPDITEDALRGATVSKGKRRAPL